MNTFTPVAPGIICTPPKFAPADEPPATTEVEPAVLLVGQPVTVTEIGLPWQIVRAAPPAGATVETLEPPTSVAGLTVRPALAGTGFTTNVYAVGKLGQPPCVDTQTTENVATPVKLVEAVAV